jgi:hypothetical protein
LYQGLYIDGWYGALFATSSQAKRRLGFLSIGIKQRMNPVYQISFQEMKQAIILLAKSFLK